MTEATAVSKIAATFDVNKIYARHLYHSADKENLMVDVANILEKKPKPFVKWVGGKRQLLKQFNEMGLYPPEQFDPISNTYFEPFVGGGAVFFDLLPQNAELSDLNRELVITYNIIKNDVEKLIKSLKKHTYEKEYYLNVRTKNPNKLSDLQVASRFIFLNRTGFNGMYRVNSQGGFNVPFGSYNNPLICDAENLRKVSKVLKNVSIQHQDYKKVLERARKGDFIYFDPPYYPVSKTALFTSYTSDGFLEKEQEELRDTFLELHQRGCFVMLSNSDTPFIDSLFEPLRKEGITVHKVHAGRNINSNASKRGRVTEVLITNY